MIRSDHTGCAGQGGGSPAKHTTWESQLFDYIRIRLRAMARTERGASAVEYGLLVALIAIAIIAGITLLGGKLNNLFSNTANKLP